MKIEPDDSDSCSQKRGELTLKTETQQQSLASSGTKRLPDEAYMPIKALNQFSYDWVIKVRIVAKGEIRTWSNDRGTGKLLNFDLSDRDGTLIQATCFNETATLLNDQLKLGKIYTFLNGQVKMANKRFTSIKHDYCLTFDNATVFQQCSSDDPRIRTDGFSFTQLAQLEDLP